MSKIIFLNPAGNITALIKDYTGSDEDRAMAYDILEKKAAEQVAYETIPTCGGDCAIHMLGDEFCANATRAYGYYYAMTDEDEHKTVNVEISGCDSPLKVYIEKETSSSYVDMMELINSDITYIRAFDYTLPVIKMDGIDHVIFDLGSDEKIALEMDKPVNLRLRSIELINEIIANNAFTDSKAVGIMFVSEDKIVPYVQVLSIGSRFWESSCGSGTTAYFYYLLDRVIKSGNYDRSNGKSYIKGRFIDASTYEFAADYKEPFGVISMKATISDHKVVKLLMGGEVKIDE